MKNTIFVSNKIISSPRNSIGIPVLGLQGQLFKAQAWSIPILSYGISHLFQVVFKLTFWRENFFSKHLLFLLQFSCGEYSIFHPDSQGQCDQRFPSRTSFLLVFSESNSDLTKMPLSFTDISEAKTAQQLLKPLQSYSLYFIFTFFFFSMLNRV